MPFYTFETSDKDVEKKIFLARLTFADYDSVVAKKPRKDGFCRGEHGPVHPDTDKPVKTWRRILDEVNIQFAQPWESSKWDNFEYRAGYNMVKAQEERRRAETLSHVGASPYQSQERVDIGQSDIANYENRMV